MRTTIPLGPITTHIVHNLERELKPNAKNWLNPFPSMEGPFRVQTYNRGRYSGRCSFTKYEYRSIMPSFIDFQGDKATVLVNKSFFEVVLPKGFVFDMDREGIHIRRIKRPSSNYHFNSDEIQDGAKELVKKLVALEKSRAKLNKETQAKKRLQTLLLKNLGNTWVMMEDSRRAGNCVQGTFAFCDNSKLSRSAVCAKSLFKLKEKVSPDVQKRIERAVMCAFERETTVSI
jgi:hypothetical protein